MRKNKKLVLFFKEVRDILSFKSSLFLFLAVSFSLGYGFLSAVTLYSEASLSALNDKYYASGFEPVSGIFVPSLGAFLIIFSFFLPFAAIRLLVKEKENNTLAILLQVPFKGKDILKAKFFSLLLIVVFVIFFAVPAAVLWSLWGGHICFAELGLLCFGYFLCGALLSAVSLLFSALFRNSYAASAGVMAFVFISWLLDFGHDMNISPVIYAASNFTYTHMLSYFENGVLSVRAVGYFFFVSLFFLKMAVNFLERNFCRRDFLFFVFLAVAYLFLNGLNMNFDFSESKRSSFPEYCEKVFKEISDLDIDIYMSRSDSRVKDYENGFLRKLLMINGKVEVRFLKDDKRYGLFVYKGSAGAMETYSNSDEEIFPIIFSVCGKNFDKSLVVDREYSGYPLFVSKRERVVVLYLYFLFIPVIIVSKHLLFLYYRRRRVLCLKV